MRPRSTRDPEDAHLADAAIELAAVVVGHGVDLAQRDLRDPTLPLLRLRLSTDRCERPTGRSVLVLQLHEDLRA